MSDKHKSSNPLRRLASSLRDLQERHRDRHRSSGFGFVVADRIDYLDPERWDAVTAQSTVFLRREILRVIENHGPENVRPRYAVIFRDEKPVAALVAQIVTVAGGQLKGEKSGRQADHRRQMLSRALAPAARVATAKWKERMIVAGNLLSWGFHGIAFAPDEDPAQLWPGVAEALYRIRRAEKLNGETDFVMLKDITAPGWRTYDDYLNALDAKYRRTARDQMKKLAAAGCIVEPQADLGTCAARIHELYLAVHGNASIKLVTLPESYLPALARAAGENFRCTVVRRCEEILGFVTTLRDGETAIAYYIGFDRAAAATGLPLYLQLLHVTIADAIAWRCKRLSLGRTALVPKAALGAKPEPMSVWLRHRVPALNWILRGLLGAVPHMEAPERSPFKEVRIGDSKQE